MKDLVVRLTALNDDLKKKLDEAKRLIKQLNDSEKQNIKTVKDVQSAYNKLNKELSKVKSANVGSLTGSFKDVNSNILTASSTLLDFLDHFERTANAAIPLELKLKNIKDAMAQMNANNLGGTLLYAQMAAAAGNYKDAIADAEASINVTANDQMRFNGMIQGLQGVAAAAGVATGAMALFGETDEDILKVMVKVQGAIALIQGLKSISETFGDKNSVFRTWVAQITKAKNEISATDAVYNKQTAVIIANNAETLDNAKNKLIASGSEVSLAKSTDISTDAFEDQTLAMLKNRSALITETGELNVLSALQLKAALLNKVQTAMLEGNTTAAKKYNTQIEELIEALNLFSEIQGDELLKDFVPDLGERILADKEKLNKLIKEGSVFREYSNLLIDKETGLLAVNTATKNKNTAATAANAAALKTLGNASKFALGEIASTGLAIFSWIGIIVAVGTAIYELIQYLYGLTDAGKAAALAAEELKLKQEKLASLTLDIGKASGEAAAKYYQLLTRWKQLSSDSLRNQWIKDNKTAFEQLGIGIDSTTTAEDLFVNNTQKVVKALIDRAVAVQKAQHAVDDYIELELKIAESLSKYSEVKKGDVISAKEANNAGVSAGFFGMGNYRITSDEIADKINEQRRKEVEAEVQRWRDRQKAILQGVEDTTKAQIEAENKLESLGDYKIGEQPSPKEYLEGSLADLDAQLSKLQDNLKKGFIELDAEDFKRQVEELENEIEAKKIELGLVAEVEAGSLEAINSLITETSAKLNLAIDDESRVEILKELAELKKQKQLIEIIMTPVIDSEGIANVNKQIQKHIEEGQFDARIIKDNNQTDQLKEELDFNKLIASQIERQYTLIHLKVALGGVLTEDEEQLVTLYDSLINKVNLLGDAYVLAANKLALLNKQSQLTAAKQQQHMDSVSKLGSAYSSLGSAIQNASDDNAKKVGTVLNSIGSLISTFADLSNTIVESKARAANIAALTAEIELLNQNTVAKEINAAAGATVATTEATESATTTTNTGALAAEASAYTVDTAAALANTSAKSGEAIASATASGAKLPFPANIAAIAAGIAAVIAALSVIGSFANGGIVGGNSYSGDKLFARVNSGEMILNRKQQANLAGMLSTPSTVNGATVEFKVRGKELVGVLNNYNSNLRKI